MKIDIISTCLEGDSKGLSRDTYSTGCFLAKAPHKEGCCESHRLNIILVGPKPAEKLQLTNNDGPIIKTNALTKSSSIIS